MPPWRRNPRPDSPPARPASAGFRITRIEPPLATPDAAPAPPESAPPDLLAARFSRPAQALSLVAAVRAAPGCDVQARREPDGVIWVLVRPYRLTDSELTRTFGGTAYLPDGPSLATVAGYRHAWEAVRGLPEVTWVELAAGVAPRPDVGEQQEVLVVTTGALARWVVDKYRSADLNLMISTARLRPVLRARSDDWPAVLIRVSGRGRTVPRALSRALAGLPSTVVCRPGTGRLLVDLRLALPLPDEELARQVPQGQEWLLAGDVGVWQVTERGPELAPPVHAEQALQPPAVPSPARFPPDLSTEVRLVPDDRPRSVDALLLEDDDLVVLRRLLGGNPAAERAFLVLGPGWHLLADPGRDVSDLPVGRPLHKVGPGGLYHEIGYRLHPPLPRLARAEVFGVDSQSLVIVRSGMALRLSLASTVPVWSLWLAPVKAAENSGAPLSPAALELLSRADAADAQVSVPDLSAGLPDPQHKALRSEGFQLEQEGKLAEAARKYWEAGDPALAARLFELAAESAGEESADTGP